MKSLLKLFFVVISINFLIGCQKRELIENNKEHTTDNINIPPEGFFIKNVSVPGVTPEEKSVVQNQTVSNNITSSSVDPDNGDIPIILGRKLPNPYSLSHMQEAVNILYGSSFPLSPSHLYIRFKPSTSDQLVALDETEELELQDYPMDYELIQDGDFYQDPSLSTEEFPWLYTVVPVGYSFPQGIHYQVLEQLYLPTNNEILEDLAESILAGAHYISVREDNFDVSRMVTIERADVEVQSFNYIVSEGNCWEPSDLYGTRIRWPDCGLGGGGNGGSTTPVSPPGIFVEEQTLCLPLSSKTLPLRQVNIVAKRWFKFWKGYTDDNGKFIVTKNFKNNVKIIAKTRNGNARISKVRGVRLWNMLLPNRVRMGVINGQDIPQFRYVFNKPTDGSASNRNLANWACATTHNSIIEFKEYSSEFGLPQPPGNLKVIVTNWGFMRGAGSAPMWNKRVIDLNDPLKKLFITFLAQQHYITAGVAAFFSTLKSQMDLIIGYASSDYTCRLRSSELRNLVFHELGHAQHFSEVGHVFWNQYADEITRNLISSGFSDPYGSGDDPIIGVSEMWGSFVENWYGERHYKNGGSSVFFVEKNGKDYYATIPFAIGLNPNFNALELFNPTDVRDSYRWIPSGLPYDLWDNRNDDTNPVIDLVSGFSIQQIFRALQSDVRSVPTFRQKLLQQNSNLQFSQVNDLFKQYGY